MPEENRFYALLFLDIPTALEVRDNQGNDEAAQFLGEVTGRLGRIRRQHGGEEVRSVGSTMLCRFDQADAALRAACEMRTVMNISRVAGTQPRLRIGLHAGEVMVQGRGFYGETVSTSARLVTLCQPGQILVSSAVHALLPEASRRALRPLAAPPDWLTSSGALYEAIAESDVVSPNDAQAAFNQAARTATRTLESAAAGAGRPVPLTALHRKHPGPEAAGEARAATAPAGERRVCLVRGRSILIVDRRTPTVTIGRDDGNDIVIDISTVSRRHAHLDWREDGVHLVDHSWNGTYVYDGQGHERHVHNAEILLADSGLLCPGCPGSHEEAEAIRYIEAH